MNYIYIPNEITRELKKFKEKNYKYKTCVKKHFIHSYIRLQKIKIMRFHLPQLAELMSEHSGMDEPLHYGGSELVQPLRKCTENP